MSEKRFSYNIIRGSRQVIIIDCHTCKSATIDVYDDDFKYFVDKLNEQDKEIGLLRLELDTHKHPLWSTREAERKLSEVTDNLANEVKKNGLLNEEINRLRIENMRLKKKGDGV